MPMDSQKNEKYRRVGEQYLGKGHHLVTCLFALGHQNSDLRAINVHIFFQTHDGKCCVGITSVIAGKTKRSLQ